MSTAPRCTAGSVLLGPGRLLRRLAVVALLAFLGAYAQGTPPLPQVEADAFCTIAGRLDQSCLAGAASNGRRILLSAGTYTFASTVVLVGLHDAVIQGAGPTTVIRADGPAIECDRCSDVTFENFRFESITEPRAVTSAGLPTADPDEPIVLDRWGTGGGYIPTVNDTDVWARLSAAQRSENFDTGLVLKAATGVTVTGLTGEYYSILFYNSSLCTVSNNDVVGGKNFAGAIAFWSTTAAGNLQDDVSDNDVSFSAYSGIFIGGGSGYTVAENTVSYSGESGIKTGQGPGQQATDAVIADNTVTNSWYDGLDLSSNYPHTGTFRAYSVATGNTSQLNNRTGLYIDGMDWLISGNKFLGNRLSGMYMDLQDSTISGNLVVGTPAQGNAPVVVGSAVAPSGDTVTGNVVAWNSPSAAAFSVGGTVAEWKGNVAKAEGMLGAGDSAGSPLGGAAAVNGGSSAAPLSGSTPLTEGAGSGPPRGVRRPPTPRAGGQHGEPAGGCRRVPRWAALALGGVALLAACGGAGPGVAGAGRLSVVPADAQLNVGMALQMTAVGSAPLGVAWSVDGVAGGNAASGTVTADGLYTAPASVPKAGAVTVEASPRGSTAKPGEATITILPKITVAVAPGAVTLNGGLTQAFAAVVANSDDQTVTWAVDGVEGGSASLGEISPTGIYTAPTAVPAGGTVEVSAASSIDPAASGTAVVSIEPPVAVVVSPPSIASPLPAGGGQQFSAAVLYTSDTAVTWSVDGIAGGNPKLGTISQQGYYTAPLSPPAGGTVTVAAISAADPAATSAVVVPLGFSDASVAGRFAFLASGSLLSTGAPLVVSGWFQADGAGNLTGGSENIAGGAAADGAQSGLALTGTYSVDYDGSGYLYMEDPSLGATVFRIVVSSQSEISLMEEDAVALTEGKAAAAPGPAWAEQQLAGSYVAELAAPEPAAGGGYVSAAAVIALNLAADGSVQGVCDAEIPGTAGFSDAPVTGQFTASADGSGALEIAVEGLPEPIGFKLSALASGGLQLAPSGGNPPLWSGTALPQSKSASSFGTGGLYVLRVSGNGPAGGFDAAGLLSFGAAGGTVTGTEDLVSSGQMQSGVDLTGSLANTSGPRLALSMSSPDGSSGAVGWAVYPVTADEAFIVGGDWSGAIYRQQLPAGVSDWSPGQLQGVLALRSGPGGAQPWAEIGVVSSDGAGGLSGGEETNDDGEIEAADGELTGSYSLASDGRGLASLAAEASDGTGTSATFVLYAISDRCFLLLPVSGITPALTLSYLY